VKVLLASGADNNQTTGYGWSPLLVTQNSTAGAYLLEHGANPNLGERGRLGALYPPPTTATSRTAIIRSRR
jgi:hypothetical protein